MTVIAEPDWHAHLPLLLSVNLQQWLQVTRFSPMIRRCCSSLENVVLREALEPLWSTEASILNETTGWVRHVLLKADNRPVVFARVAVGLSTYHRHQSTFDELKEALLGESVLYQQQAWVRGSFEYAALNNDSLVQLAEGFGAHLRGYPARRSLFTHEASSLLLTEVFYPTCPSFPVLEQEDSI